MPIEILGYWDIRGREGILFEDRTEGLLSQAIFQFAISYYIIGRGYESGLFRIFFGSQTD